MTNRATGSRAATPRNLGCRIPARFAARVLSGAITLAASCALAASCGESGGLRSGDSGGGNPTAPERFAGDWTGTLVADGREIGMTLRIASVAGAFAATLDVPSQNLSLHPASSVEIDGDGIRVGFSDFSASFEASLDGERLSGFWRQRGRDFALALERTAAAGPAERYGVSVRFSGGAPGVELAGSLVLPPGSGPFPVAILLTGSGAQDRDETLFGHRPFETIARALAEAGIASLRFDDRGYGESTGDFASAGLSDFVADALAAMEAVSHDERLDSARAGFIGHSEGAVVALEAAVRRPETAFVVALAGPFMPGRELLLAQTEALLRGSGALDAEVRGAMETNARIYDLAASAGEYPRASIDDILMSAGMGKDARDAQHQALSSKWFRDFLASDPEALAARAKAPIFACFGDKDTQVPAKENAYRAGRAIMGREGSKVTTWTGLNHLFQQAITGMPDEYGRIPTGLDPDVARAVARWIAATTAR